HKSLTVFFQYYASPRVLHSFPTRRSSDLSRGFTPKSGLYTSQQTAGPSRQELVSGRASDVDKYHDNCNCYAEPVYSRDQLRNSPLFALNRRYAREWPSVTAGRSGKDALSAWRKHIRSQQS